MPVFRPDLTVSIGASSVVPTGPLVFSNAGGVTFGLTGSTVTASAPAGGGGLTNVRLSAGTLSAYRSDVTLGDAHGISFGLDTNGSVTASYVPGVNQVDAGGGGIAAQVISFGDANGVSFGISADGSVTASVATSYLGSNAGSNFVAASAGFAGTNVTGTIASNGISVSAAAVPTKITITVIGQATQTSSGTVFLTAFRVAGRGGISVGYDGTPTGSNMVISCNTGAYITTARGSTDALGLNTAGTNVTWTANSSGVSLDAGGYAGTGFTSATTAGVAIVGTQNTAGLSLGVPAIITTARRSTDAIGLNTAGTNVTWTVNSSGLSLDAGGYAAASAAVGLNTAKTHATWTVNSSGISLDGGGYCGTNVNLVTIVGNAPSLSLDSLGISLALPVAITTARASTDAIGLNTAKTAATWTVNSSGFSLDAGAYLTTAMASNRGSDFVAATAAFAGTGASGTIASNGVSVSVGAAVITPINFYEPWAFEIASATSSGGLGTLHVLPMVPQYPISFAQVNVIASAVLQSTTAGNTMTFSNTGANSFVFQYGVSNTNSCFVDLYLFSKGTGGFSTNLQTFASTRNSFVTFQNHTYQLSVSNGAGSTGSWSLKSSVSVQVSFPGMTSGTMTSVSTATTITTWGTGYAAWTSSTSTSNSTTYNSTATASASLAGTWPATTAWASMKLVPLMFGTSLSAGEYWLGMNRASSTSSSSSSGTTNVAAGKTYTSSVAGSNLTLSAPVMSYMGKTNTIANSLGYMGANTAASMLPAQAQGSFTATYSPGSTYVNNAGQPNGAIAISDIQTNVSMFGTWLQFANYRI